MKLAVIDCGTNTFNLIIVKVQNGKKPEKVFHTRVAVKLGEGTVNDGYIAEKPFQRGLSAIEQFAGKIREYGAEKVLAFATSAIRDGRNGNEFVKAVKDQFSIDIDIIDGDREAELVYYGIREAVKLNESTSLIMDIGGGSTEFILANNEKIMWKHSFNIGAARLLARFSPSDKITPEQISAIKKYLDEQLQPLFSAVKKFSPSELVGSSGAFESFVEMIHCELRSEQFAIEKTEYTVDLDDYRSISSKVINSTLAERQKIRGLVPMRFDMIVICCLMVDFILEKCALSRMRISTYSLKEGAMVDFIAKLK